MYTYNIFMLYT